MAAYSRKKKQSSNGKHTTLLNSAIGILTILLIAFIFSFSNKHTRSGVTMDSIQMTFPNLPEQTKLAAEVYEENPILDIQVEILNGCGTNGLAGHAASYLQSNQIDVVRSTNADHYDYDKTLLIGRNEHLSGLKEVATSLGFNVKDRSRVLIQPDASSDVDITLILGKDHINIKPLVQFIDQQL